MNLTTDLWPPSGSNVTNKCICTSNPPMRLYDVLYYSRRVTWRKTDVQLQTPVCTAESR